MTPGYERFEALCAEADIGDNEGEDCNPILRQQAVSVVEKETDPFHAKEIENPPCGEICAFDTVVNDNANNPTPCSIKTMMKCLPKHKCSNSTGTSNTSHSRASKLWPD